ncbi:hypothetical protein CYLTODRAFT_422872 [Cylindrobasidium torrendii FP15055 ss-10]|uniref:Uncharacterized protein n=1 Tax=Cylindrobasidium torrendii FP15055 ss-10 TaxID=1314674 RepID=A0A0D7B8Z4_9AGAR|nr:hypothetical protein CYLTODRAFT_422872 [Cylindrobasidium torrendii FP15055 ss-10]
MQMQSRTRLYNARLSVAQSLPYMRVNGVRLVKLLGTNGMSSEEDDPHDDSTALIRSLDWRAPQCVPFLRHLDTVHTARRAFGRRGILAHFDESDAEEDMEVDEGAVPDGRRFKRTRRRRVPAAPIASHRNAKPNPEMPHNLYNWAVMQERLGVTEYDRDTYIRPSAPDPTLFDINFPRRNNAAPPPA